MKKILFIAPASVPVDGPEAIVNAKLLSILVDAGYKIDVISKRGKLACYPETDYSIIDKLNSLHIIKIDNKVNLETLYYHFMSFVTFGVVYRGAHWAYKALNYIRKNLILSEYSIVITKSYPSELVGYWLKKKKKIKWIATWNDPFPIEMYPYPYGKDIHRLPWYMNNLLEMIRDNVDYNVFPSKRLYCYMNEYIGFPEESVRIIPHVALPEKCNLISYDNGKLKLLVSGNNQYPRDPKLLLTAFANVINNLEIDVELSFVGKVDRDAVDLVESLNLSKYVNIYPSVPYDESMVIAKKYDVAILIEAPCKEGIFLPTKIVDFMQIGIPVFAISPSIGELNDMYKTSNIGYFADCMDEKMIECELLKLFSDYKRGNIKKTIMLSSLSSENILKQYSEMIDE